MGTEITLEIAGMTLDWSKNSRGADHGALFQSIDRRRFRSDQINYEYFEESGEDPALMEMGFTRKLKDILTRLGLLGFTRDQAKLEYLRAVQLCREEDQDRGTETPRDVMGFEEFCAFVAAHPIEMLDTIYDRKKDREQIKGRFSGDAATQRLPHCLSYRSYYQHAYSERTYFGELIGFLHPYSVLRVLAENAQNQEADVVWQYGPLVEAGWAEETEFMPGARRSQTFLIATEGSSDAHILKHAISLLCPEIGDFFSFYRCKRGPSIFGGAQFGQICSGARQN